MKATEEYFLVVLFIMLYQMVLAFESVDEILKYDCVAVKSFSLALSISSIVNALRARLWLLLIAILI